MPPKTDEQAKCCKQCGAPIDVTELCRLKRRNALLRTGNKQLREDVQRLRRALVLSSSELLDEHCPPRQPPPERRAMSDDNQIDTPYDGKQPPEPGQTFSTAPGVDPASVMDPKHYVTPQPDAVANEDWTCPECGALNRADAIHSCRECYTIRAEPEPSPAPAAEIPSSILCEHGEQVPVQCMCPPNCYCRHEGSCKNQPLAAPPVPEGGGGLVRVLPTQDGFCIQLAERWSVCGTFAHRGDAEAFADQIRADINRVLSAPPPREAAGEACSMPGCYFGLPHYHRDTGDGSDEVVPIPPTTEGGEPLRPEDVKEEILEIDEHGNVTPASSPTPPAVDAEIEAFVEKWRHTATMDGTVVPGEALNYITTLFERVEAAELEVGCPETVGDDGTLAERIATVQCAKVEAQSTIARLTRERAEETESFRQHVELRDEELAAAERKGELEGLRKSTGRLGGAPGPEWVDVFARLRELEQQEKRDG